MHKTVHRRNEERIVLRLCIMDIEIPSYSYASRAFIMDI